MSDQILVGRIAGVFGVKGWVKVFSYTRPLNNILQYSPWLISQHGKTVTVEVADGNIQGKGIIARLAGCDDRDQAMTWVGADIEILRSQLPDTDDDEIYWSDLIGLEVVTRTGKLLGKVAELVETGNHDVLVIRGATETLIPAMFDHYIVGIDREAGRIEVDWEDPD